MGDIGRHRGSGYRFASSQINIARIKPERLQDPNLHRIKALQHHRKMNRKYTTQSLKNLAGMMFRVKRNQPCKSFDAGLLLHKSRRMAKGIGSG